MSFSTPIAELLGKYTEELCDFTNREWVKAASLRYSQTVPNRTHAFLLKRLSQPHPAPWWVQASAYQEVSTMQDSQVRCLLYALVMPHHCPTPSSPP